MTVDRTRMDSDEFAALPLQAKAADFRLRAFSETRGMRVPVGDHLPWRKANMDERMRIADLILGWAFWGSYPLHEFNLRASLLRLGLLMLGPPPR